MVIISGSLTTSNTKIRQEFRNCLKQPVITIHLEKQKTHGNSPKFESDFQKKTDLCFTCILQSQYPQRYLNTKNVFDTCTLFTPCKHKYFDNLKIQTDYKSTQESYPFIFPPSTGTSFNAMIREQTVGEKIFNQICHPPQNYLIFFPTVPSKHKQVRPHAVELILNTACSLLRLAMGPECQFTCCKFISCNSRLVFFTSAAIKILFMLFSL